MLQSLGLDSKAEATYRLMLARSDWHITEIADHLGVTETEVRAILQRLTDLGLLRCSLAQPRQLLPVTPALAFQALLQHQRAELLQKQQEFIECQAEVTRLTAEYSTLCCPPSRNELEHIYGSDAIQTRLEALEQRATAECLSFMPGGAQSPDTLTALRPLHESMLNRGLKVLTLYLDSVWNDSQTLHYARWLVNMGGEVRTVPSLPLGVVIFDRNVGVISANPGTSSQAAVQVSGQGVMTAIVALFERVWETGMSLGHPPNRDEQGVTAQERELLRSLSQGLTDEVVGRRLGLSLRTVRRMMADISDRLDARSRFEVGVKASQRGWLDPDLAASSRRTA